MKAVILAGGFGTRLAEETEVKPKPMVAIGERPILWHIMKHYTRFGIHEFCIALGYKGDVIKRFFLDYYALAGSMTVHLRDGRVQMHDQHTEDWKVHLVDTGLQTATGGRLQRLEKYLTGETFMLTYGDGVSDVDLDALLAFHRSHNRLATMTIVRPTARFGSVKFEGQRVVEFIEKPQAGEGWINGGFFVFESGVFEYIRGPQSSLESDVLEQLADDDQLAAYKHDRFWQCMDTLRDLRRLEQLWQDGNPPWKVWRD